MATLTSANSILMIGVSGLFNIPVKIQGFATDDMFTSDDLDIAETHMGCDGRLSAGYVPNPKPLTITLQADSPSNDFFDALVAATEVSREVYEVNATIQIPSIGRQYSFTRGFLKRTNKMAGAKKTLQPRQFAFDFQDMTPAPV